MANNTESKRDSRDVKIKFIGTKKMAEIVDVSINTIYFWVYTKQIPYYKIGNLVKFDVNEIKTWLEKKRVKVQHFG